MSKRAAVYLRISLDRNGDGLAVDRQKADCLRIIAERGWTLVETYEDASKSAYRKNVHRPAYERMVQDYSRGMFDAIVVWDLDRLTRQPVQLEAWIDAAEERGLVLVTASGEADLSTDNGRLFARIKAAVARGDMERKSVRQKAKNAQNVALGRPVPGKRRFGFEPGNVLERPAEADIVRAMYADVLSGRSIFSIAQEQGKLPVRVRETLTNPAYAGWVVRKGERFEAAPEVARIVDRDTWDAVQALLSDPARKISPGNKIKYLASGIARCGVCGARMVKQSRYYLCKGHVGHPTINVEILDDLLMWEAFTAVASREHTDPAEVTALAGQLADLQARRASWQEQATWEGADLAYIRTEVAALGKQIEQVSDELTRARTTSVGEDVVGALRSQMSDEAGAEWWEEKWNSLPLEVKRDLIRGLDIRVHNGRGTDRVEVH
ncbi:MAG: recombinase family protein [Protaetiibacter sp.]